MFLFCNQSVLGRQGSLSYDIKDHIDSNADNKKARGLFSGISDIGKNRLSHEPGPQEVKFGPKNGILGSQVV